MATASRWLLRKPAEDYDAKTQSRLIDGVWSMCASWYRNANGRITTNWPGTVTEYRRATATYNVGDFDTLERTAMDTTPEQSRTRNR